MVAGFTCLRIEPLPGPGNTAAGGPRRAQEAAGASVKIGVIAMENTNRIDPALESVPERDVLAMLAMLDYLIAEIARVDALSAECLMLARKSLADAVADALVSTH